MIGSISICGAGLGGLTAAIALSETGADIAVYEKAEVLGEVGAGIQLSPNAMKVLRRVGLEDEVLANGFEPEFATVRRWDSGAAYLRMPLRDDCRARYGAPYVHIHRADLHGVLEEEARRLGVHFHLGQQITGYARQKNGAKIHLAEGASVGSDLVVAADGVRSVISQEMNPDAGLRFTGQVAWRGCLPAKALPEGLVPQDATVWAGEGKHFVAYYLRGGKMVNFVAVEERDDWRDDSWTHRGDVEELRAAFAGWNPVVTGILDAVEETFLWALFDRPEVPRWHDGHVALLGDACHPTLPFMAQGAAMAIEDSAVLARVLLEGDGIKDVEDGLARYEAVRKPRARYLQARARANAGLFHLHGAQGGIVPRAKLILAGFLPKGLGVMPFERIYSYDAVKDWPIQTA